MTDGETKQIFLAITHIKELKTAEALKQVYELAREQYNYARNREARTMGWFVGQEVKLKPENQRRKPWDGIGKILKVNRVRLRVDFGSLGIYNCPKTIVDPVR